MTPKAALEAVSWIKYKHEELTNGVAKLEKKLEEAEEAKAAHDRSYAILTLLSDAELNDFLTALSTAADAVVSELFGPGYKVSFKSVGKKGIRVWLTHNGVDDGVLDSQGGGVCNVISISLLLSAFAASHRIPGGFILLDEPFAGAVQQEKLAPLYRRVSEAAEALGIQVVATTHHEAAAQEANNVITLGCNPEIELV